VIGDALRTDRCGGDALHRDFTVWRFQLRVTWLGSLNCPEAAGREDLLVAVHDLSRTSASEHRNDDGPLCGLLSV